MNIVYQLIYKTAVDINNININYWRYSTAMSIYNFTLLGDVRGFWAIQFSPRHSSQYSVNIKY